MAFNPQEHMSKIRGNDYLEVKWRIVWFRDKNPDGRIDTDVTLLGDMVVVKASVWNNDGTAIASGLAMVRSDQKATWAGRDIEKAETAAIGRALAVAGYGTQFTGDEMSEGDFLADSPVGHSSPPPNITHGNFNQSDDAWLPEIRRLTHFLYDHPSHQENSIDKLIREKSITPEMSPIAAAAMVFLHKAQGKNLSKDDIQDALGMEFKTYMKAGGTLQEAWQKINTESEHQPTGTEGIPPPHTDDIPF